MPTARTPGTRAKCPDCDLLVLWGTTAAGRPIMLDPVPAKVLTGFDKESPHRNMQIVNGYTAHQATCKRFQIGKRK